MESLLTMPEIARLAKVKRQAVTNWRSRPVSSPFPSPAEVLDGIERFRLEDILDWLEATGLGRNREARLDAPAVAARENLSLERAVVLLTLRAKVAQDIGTLSAPERIALAEQVDPDDRFLLSEVREFAGDDELARYVDGLMEAAFGPSDALARLYKTRPAQGVRGFAPELVTLLQTIAAACRTFLGPDDVSVELRLEPRAREIAAGFSFAYPGSEPDRAMLRHLELDGLVIDGGDGPRVRVLSVVGTDDSKALDLADETALDLASGQIAIVVGPATALCDRLAGALYRARRKTLEMGGSAGSCALAAAFKLPRGLWREAHRQSLGLWVLQGGAAATGVVVADLSAREVAVAELADDVLGALERTGARAYRYGRVLPYTDVWTRDTVVVPGIGAAPKRARQAVSANARLIEATLVTQEKIDGFDLPLSGQSRSARPSPRSLGELADSRIIQVQSGTRISTDHLAPEAELRVLSADINWPTGRIDVLVAVDRYSHATRTEPGDVVFIAKPDPRAVVDEEGGSIVASPSRVLRFDPLQAGIGPRALAAGINRLFTNSEWRTWPVLNVPRAQIQELEDALGGVQSYLAILRRHEEAATNIITNLIEGVAEGSVALGSTINERKAA